MSEVHQHDDAKARFSLRVWRPVLSRALSQRAAVTSLIGAGVFVAAIETALPLIVGRIVDAARGGSADELAPVLAVYATVFVFFAAGVWLFIESAGDRKSVV